MGKKKPILIKEVNDGENNEIGRNLNIMSWNVMAVEYTKIQCDHKKRVEGELDYLYESNMDIIYLQEVDLHFMDLLSKHKLLGEYYVYQTDLDPYGLVTLSKWKMNLQIYKFGKTSHKKVLILGNNEYQFINIHLRATNRGLIERTSQVKKILEYMVDNSKIVILGGDTNMITEEEKIDEWYDLAQSNKDFTFNNKNKYAENVGLSHRFDRLYTNIKPQSILYNIKKIVLSDHYPIITEIVY